MENKETNYQVETEFDDRVYNFCKSTATDYIMGELFEDENTWLTCGQMKRMHGRLLKIMYASMKDWLDDNKLTKDVL